ncbi:DNA repair protein RecN [Clostridiaceae bacterium 35-E11]
MLLELAIENFALIAKLNISFHKGLNILTGETGAGKSIIIDAVNMAIGERADKSYIRTGADKAVIQTIFYSKNPYVKDILNEKGIDLLDDNIVILTREIYNSGRSISRINDRVVTVSLIKEISKYLIDIHGQHAHQSLLYPENHIDILDAFDETRLMGLKKQVANKFYELKKLQNKLISLYGNELERERKKDLLKFQLEEIDCCNLKKEEEAELISEQNLLSNSERILNIMSNAYEKLFNNEHRYPSIIDSIGHVVKELENIKEFDSNILNMFNILQECLYMIEDVSRDVRNYRDHIEFNPHALQEVEKRLDLINNLKRKYGNTIEEILYYREKIFIELQELENSENIINDLKSKIEKATKELRDCSLKLSEIRKSIAAQLENKIIEELMSLNMNHVAFKINFIDNEQSDKEYEFTAKGIDKIEFLISTNVGEELKPLSKIASGGEMSRIMLAFKTILAASDNIETLIFDEIDSGISGVTANIVGEKLAIISKTHQILCITHLPQIALMADNHFYIEKITQDYKTSTNVRGLSEKEQIMELGRLLGGVTLTNLTMEHAKEMLDLGNQFKKNLL